MWQGTVESIHIASAAREPMRAVQQAEAIPGVGLEGDRYANGQGTFYKPEALRREYGVELAAGEARRNVVTRGVPLNHLVGREFRIGAVKIRGIRLCEPCDHLQGLTGRPLIKGLRHRGGLRAQILSRGAISVADLISE